MAYDPKSDLPQFRRWRAERVLTLASEGGPDLIHGSLVLAIGSRESNLRNIVGGGFFDNAGNWHTTGVDRGFLQINAGYHENWLRSVPGCITGEWAEVYSTNEGGAYPEGRCPGLTAATKKCIATLRWNITYARNQGVPEADVLRCAVAGWNGGVGSTVRAYKTYGDPDRVTTNRNYSADVLARQKAIRSFLKSRGWFPNLS